MSTPILHRTRKTRWWMHHPCSPWSQPAPLPPPPPPCTPRFVLDLASAATSLSTSAPGFVNSPSRVRLVVLCADPGYRRVLTRCRFSKVGTRMEKPRDRWRHQSHDRRRAPAACLHASSAPIDGIPTPNLSVRWGGVDSSYELSEVPNS